MTLILILAVLLLIWFSRVPEPWRLGFFVVLLVLLVLTIVGYTGLVSIPPHLR